MRVLLAAGCALMLGACATSDTAYRHGDGSYRGPYDGGYYAAAHNGYGDYYYDRPQIVYDEGYACNGFGYGFGPPGWSFGAGFGYDPWFGGSCFGSAGYGFGYPYYWYRPWPRHHHHGPPDSGHAALTIGDFGATERSADETRHAVGSRQRSAMRPQREPRESGERFVPDPFRFDPAQPRPRPHSRNASQDR